MQKTLIYLLLFLSSSALVMGDYPRNPHVDPALWDSMVPYFIPESHPIKKKLDAIFHKRKRVIASSVSLAIAGFTKVKPWVENHLIITRHKSIDGYLLKLFTDEMNVGNIALQWRKRVKNARLIQQLINKHHYQHFFKVPKKWIYPLPAEPSPPMGVVRQDFILIVQNMRLLTHADNIAQWQGPFMTDERMKALFQIIYEGGLFDSVYIHNVPFCEDGRQAFVDTEHSGDLPIRFEKLTPFFAEELLPLWNHLISTAPQKQLGTS